MLDRPVVLFRFLMTRVSIGLLFVAVASLEVVSWVPMLVWAHSPILLVLLWFGAPQLNPETTKWKTTQHSIKHIVLIMIIYI